MTTSHSRYLKERHLGANIFQNSSQRSLRATNPPKLSKSVVVLLVFTLRPFLRRSPPRPLKIAKMTPQVASRWPAKPHLGPSWRHLGPILAPSSAILPQFWASRACPKLAKIGQDSFQDDFHAKVAPKTSQTPPDLDIHCFRDHF